MPTNLIGLLGQKSSGKTTLSYLLYPDWQLTSFATPIKHMISSLLEYQKVPAAQRREMLYGKDKEIPTSYLNNKSPRHAMQTLGTEWRALIHRDLWIDIWERTIDLSTQKIIVDDARFIHETNKIKSLGGKIIKIHRPSLTSSLDPHPSEQEQNLIIPDFTIINDSTPQHMLDQLKSYLGENL